VSYLAFIETSTPFCLDVLPDVDRASGFEASDAFQAEIRADFSKKRIPKIISVSGVIGTDRHRAVNGEYTLTSGIEDWQLSYTHKTTSDLKLAL
jgi:hypothetical protein